jgi:hypothetical protein
MSRKPLSNLDDFNFWVADMDDALDSFKASLPADVAAQLDYTPASLDALEHWLLDTYASSEETQEAGQTANMDGAARYFGETFRKTMGGYWDIDLDNQKNVYFGVPVVTGYKEKSTPLCPLWMVGAATHRRTGTSLRTILQNYQEGLLLKRP